jgi:cytochrome P450
VRVRDRRDDDGMTAHPTLAAGDPISDFFLDDPRKLDDPFADLAWLREHHPVYWHEPVKQWFVFPYEDVQSLFSDSRLSANRAAAFLAAVPETVRDDVRALLPTFEKWLIFSDGDEHSRRRTALHHGLNAKAIEALRGAIERSANDLLDRASSSGQLDVGADYGYLLPVYVLSDFMGVPPEGRDLIAQWSADFVDFFNVIPITVDSTKRMVTATTEMMTYIGELLRRRRSDADDGFFGAMAAVSAGGDITDDEIVGNTVLMLIAGHIAVRNLIGNVVWLLLTHPGDYDRVREDPSMLRSVIQESLRYEPPITQIPRVAMEDIEVRDQRISAGDVIQLSIIAANRDPLHFTDPDRFDIARNPQGLLSFGHGPHGCFGALLALEQTSIALETLFRRAGDSLRLDDRREIRWYRNADNRGPENLPVRFG